MIDNHLIQIEQYKTDLDKLVDSHQNKFSDTYDQYSDNLTKTYNQHNDALIKSYNEHTALNNKNMLEKNNQYNDNLTKTFQQHNNALTKLYNEHIAKLNNKNNDIIKLIEAAEKNSVLNKQYLNSDKIKFWVAISYKDKIIKSSGTHTPTVRRASLGLYYVEWNTPHPLGDKYHVIISPRAGTINTPIAMIQERTSKKIRINIYTYKGGKANDGFDLFIL